jgi:hypothetical protein
MAVGFCLLVGMGAALLGVMEAHCNLKGELEAHQALAEAAAITLLSMGQQELLQTRTETYFFT